MVDESDNDFSYLLEDDEVKPRIYVMVLAKNLDAFIRFRDSMVNKCNVQKRTQGSFTVENKLFVYVSEPDRQLRGRRNFETVYYGDWFRHPKARLISDILEYHVKAKNIRAESRIYE